MLLDIALDPARELDRLELETLSNDAVIGDGHHPARNNKPWI